jgi:hypothetical protein
LGNHIQEGTIGGAPSVVKIHQKDMLNFGQKSEGKILVMELAYMEGQY